MAGERTLSEYKMLGVEAQRELTQRATDQIENVPEIHLKRFRVYAEGQRNSAKEAMVAGLRGAGEGVESEPLYWTGRLAQLDLMILGLDHEIGLKERNAEQELDD